MKMKILKLIALLICCSSLVISLKLQYSNNLESLRKKFDANEIFHDDLAIEDRYDPNIRTRRRYVDLNNEIKADENEVMRRIRDDLTGEKVNYKFD